MRQVMIDVETLGTGMNCVVLSMAAVAFDPDDPEPVPVPVLGDAFDRQVLFARLSIDEQLGMNRRVDEATLQWWSNPHLSEALRRAVGLKGEVKPYAYAVMNHLKAFIGPDEDTVPVWSHGSGFDLPILRSLARDVGLVEPPWSHRFERDTRTLFALVPKEVYEVKWPMGSVAHDPVWDAWRQAESVRLCYQHLALMRVRPVASGSPL